MAPILQRIHDQAVEALEIAARCVVDEHPLITPYKDSWLLSETAIRVASGRTGDREALRRRRVLWYRTPDVADGPRCSEAAQRLTATSKRNLN